MSAVMYRCFDATGRLIYVGSTGRWGRRIGEHRRQSWWFPMLDQLRTEWHPTLEAAQAAEATAIQEEQPAFNWRDTGRGWLGRRDAWTDADRELHQSWHAARGMQAPRLAPPLRSADRSPNPGGSYYIAPRSRRAS